MITFLTDGCSIGEVITCGLPLLYKTDSILLRITQLLDSVAPDVNMASSKKIKTGSVGAAAAALAGLGTASIVGGKVYLDKKKKDEEEEEDDSYDEFFDEKDDANEQESSVVDFKNEILQDV